MNDAERVALAALDLYLWAEHFASLIHRRYTINVWKATHRESQRRSERLYRKTHLDRRAEYRARKRSTDYRRDHG